MWQLEGRNDKQILGVKGNSMCRAGAVANRVLKPSTQLLANCYLSNLSGCVHGVRQGIWEGILGEGERIL